MIEPDYYQILQVDPKAEPEVVQAAYRRLAAKYHPDVNKTAPEAERRMKELNAAYSVLGDADARAEYDGTYVRSGSRDRQGTRARPPARPRFEVRPQTVEIRGVDPSRPIVYPEIQLSLTSREPFDPAIDGIDFTLKPPFNGALLRGVDFLSAGSPFLVRLTLDLGYMRHEPGRSHVGTINVKGDPSATFLLVVEFGASTAPVSYSRSQAPAEAGAQEPAARRSWPVVRFWYWLLQPLCGADADRPTWQGLAARLAIVLGFSAAAWIIATNLVTIAGFFA